MTCLRTILIALLALGLTACAGLRPEPPDVQLAGLEITDVSLSHANFLARLRLYNPNPGQLDVQGVRFVLSLNDIRVANGRTAKPLLLPAEGEGELSLRLASSFLDLIELAASLQGQDMVTFRIVGEVEVGGYGLLGTTIAIERQGRLPLTGGLDRLLKEIPRQ